MKNFVQTDSFGVRVGLFHMNEGSEDYGKPVSEQSIVLSAESVYSAMVVGQSVRFSCMTTLTRVA